MSSFSVVATRVRKVEKHPQADRLTLNYIGDFIAISNLDDQGQPRYAAGDLVVYIPESAVVPDWLLRRIHYWDEEKGRGILAGSQGNRVKAVKLRGILSQGIIMPVRDGNIANETDSLDIVEGDDVADFLGIVKYVPPVPTHLDGEVCALFGHTLIFDIENIKRYPDIIADGTDVTFTEKLHGTLMQAAMIPGLAHDELTDGDCFVASKGLAGRGLVFKNNAANAKNIYLATAKKIDIFAAMKRVFDASEPVYVLGEVYGPGVQDLHYGLRDKAFAIFAIYRGAPGRGRYLNDAELDAAVTALGLPRVPVLYRGPFSKEAMRQFTTGKTTVGEAHMREGIVITPRQEMTHPEIGRVTLKSINDDYLLRKGAVTEYE